MITKKILLKCHFCGKTLKHKDNDNRSVFSRVNSDSVKQKIDNKVICYHCGKPNDIDSLIKKTAKYEAEKIANQKIKEFEKMLRKAFK